MDSAMPPENPPQPSFQGLSADGTLPAGRQGYALPILLIAACITIVFAQTAQFDFIRFDDGRYVYENSRVLNGLTLDGMGGAFTKEIHAMWIPVTMLSYLVDAELFGTWAGGYHLSNAFYHLLAALSLYAALRALTLQPGRSLFVALVFAIHPLRAESVAWISERKDVLCALFWFLSLWAYARHVHQPSFQRRLWVFLFALLALMSKSMAVTLPFTLLLLDWWPLRRIEGAPFFSLDFPRRLGRRIMEKADLFLLALAGAVMAVITQHASKAISSMEHLSLSGRAALAVVSYLRYLGHFFYPVRLSFFYPFPENGYPPLWILTAAVLLMGISLVCLFYWRARFLATGWLWFLGTLAPVIGLVQIGSAGMADRYLYVPSIGLTFIIAWSLPEAWLRSHPGTARAVAVSIIALLLILACHEVSYYRDTETLFRRAMAVTEDNFMACEKLGEIHMERGELEEAFHLYERAYELYPRSAESNYNLGSVLLQKNSLARAAQLLAQAVQLNPSHGLAHTNLGIALLQLDRLSEAMPHLAEGARLLPNNVNAHINYGAGLLKQNRPDAAVREFEKALRLDPSNEAARTNLFAAQKALEGKNTRH